MNTKELPILIVIKHGKSVGMGMTCITVGDDEMNKFSILKNAEMLSFLVESVEYKHTNEYFVKLTGSIQDTEVKADFIYTVDKQVYDKVKDNLLNGKLIESAKSDEGCIMAIKSIIDKYDPFIMLKDNSAK